MPGMRLAEPHSKELPSLVSNFEMKVTLLSAVQRRSLTVCASVKTPLSPAPRMRQFSRARIYKLLRYPSVKDVRWVPRPLHPSLASSWVHMPLSLSWLSFLAADRLNRSPPVSPGGSTSCLADASPRQPRCANSPSKRQALTPQTGLRLDKHVSNCSRTLVTTSPASYRHGLPSKITLKKVIPSRPDSGSGSGRPEAEELNGRTRDVDDSRQFALRVAAHIASPRLRPSLSFPPTAIPRSPRQ